MVTEMASELVTIPQNDNPYAIMPAMDVQTAAYRRQALIDYTAAMMVKGRDFGKIPGAGDKPTLLKPGAEKLASLFGLSPQFDTVEQVMDWTGADHDGEPFFYIRCRCTLTRGDWVVGQGVGSCNSWEKKYRYRRDGSKHPNPADIVNTIDKMAQKRALVAAVLIAVNASEFFTQDVEDYSEIVDGDWQPAKDNPRPQAQTRQPQPAPMPDDELVISEASAREFVTAAAALLDTDTEAVKERMKLLGYTAVPGKPDERVKVYRRLKEPQAQPANGELFPPEQPQVVGGGGAYQE